MKFATFVAELNDQYAVQLPKEVCDSLKIQPGDRIEISLKRIRSRKLELFLSENPLYKLLQEPARQKDAPEE